MIILAGTLIQVQLLALHAYLKGRDDSLDFGWQRLGLHVEFAVLENPKRSGFDNLQEGFNDRDNSLKKPNNIQHFLYRVNWSVIGYSERNNGS